MEPTGRRKKKFDVLFSTTVVKRSKRALHQSIFAFDCCLFGVFGRRFFDITPSSYLTFFYN